MDGDNVIGFDEHLNAVTDAALTKRHPEYQPKLVHRNRAFNVRPRKSLSSRKNKSRIDKNTLFWKNMHMLAIFSLRRSDQRHRCRMKATDTVEGT